MNRDTELTNQWVEYLCIPALNGANDFTLLDFNRFRYKGVPSTTELKGEELNFELVNRDDLVKKIFTAINDREGVAVATKASIFDTARKHFVFCDSHNPPLQPLSDSAFSIQCEHISKRQRLGEIKDSTEGRMISSLNTLFRWLDIPTKHLLPKGAFSKHTQQENTRGYSDNDLKKILPLLRGIFKQLSTQFIENPESHVKAKVQQVTGNFTWKGKEYPVTNLTSKLIAAATYLLSYYTWCNSSVIFSLTRPSMSSHSPSENWHQMPAFKRRAFKTITVEIGENNRLEVPKYAMSFFDQLLIVSTILDPRPDGLLLPSFSFRTKKIQMMGSSRLNTFKVGWLAKHFPMLDDRGERLWPVIRRFRATGGELALAQKGIIEAAILLDNTPNVVATAYSGGNIHENMRMNQDVSLTLEQVARDRSEVEKAKQKVRDSQKIEVLAYEEYINRLSPINRSAHGSYCNDTSGIKGKKFTAKAISHQIIEKGESLVCADLLSCWSCEHQVLVESVPDIWCILSFRDCLEDSIYLHVDSNHFAKNFGKAIHIIDQRLKIMNSKIVKKARQKLADDGRHPLWVDAASVNLY
ncbi:MAG: hypothetical protein LAT53_10595 [Idiomarina sp.]|nr:hypothetical protein [Idiomarina sp.]